MDKILASACLLGAPVRHDGGHKRVSDARIEVWRREGRLVPVCPEEAGGLGTPRPASEIMGSRVVASTGADVTSEFERGAKAALDLARRHGCRFALLKENSPSCGVNFVHDGSFSGRKVGGAGVTAALLRAQGVQTFSENDLDALEAALRDSAPG